MAGEIPQNNVGALVRPDVQPAPQGQVGQETPTEETNVSVESQDAYDRVVMAGMKVLFEDEKANSSIVERLKSDDKNPAKSLADTTAMLIIQLDKQSGGKIPEDVILPAAIELLEQTSELADSLGIFPVDEAVMNHAAQLMVVSLGEEYGVSPEDVQALMESTSTEELQQVEVQQGEYARKQPPQEML